MAFRADIDNDPMASEVILRSSSRDGGAAEGGGAAEAARGGDWPELDGWTLLEE